MLIARTECNSPTCSRSLTEAQRLRDYFKKRKDDRNFDESAFYAFVDRVLITPERKSASIAFRLTCGLTLTEIIIKKKNH